MKQKNIDRYKYEYFTTSIRYLQHQRNTVDKTNKFKAKL